MELGMSGDDSFSYWENQTWALLNSGEDFSAKTEEPPPPPPPPGKKRERDCKNGENGNDNGKGDAAESDHEIHIWTERERRKKMRTMFSNLHALLPHLPPKQADKSTIVDEAVSYIKTLQQTLQKLQKQKVEKTQNNVSVLNPPCESSSREAFMADHGSSTVVPVTGNAYSAANFQTWTSSNVILSICGNEAQISICCAKKAGLFSTICYVLEKHKIEVVSAHISSHFNRTMFMIQAHANNEFGEGFLVEDAFKQAAGEIIFWISS